LSITETDEAKSYPSASMSYYKGRLDCFLPEDGNSLIPLSSCWLDKMPIDKEEITDQLFDSYQEMKMYLTDWTN
jgi:hypothetical protein